MKMKIAIGLWAGVFSLLVTISSAQPVSVTEVPLSSRSFTAVNEFVFFSSEEGLHRTDGTKEGTLFLSSVRNAHAFLQVGEIVYFLSLESDDMTALWRSDGTRAGTFTLTSMKDFIFMGATSEYLFFAGWVDASGRELYRTNGQPGGTIRLKDINPGTGSGLSHQSLYYAPYLSPERYRGAVLNNELYFAGNDGITGEELWKSDGTPEGTVLVRDINPGPASGVETGPFVAYNDRVYLRGDDGVHGPELWSTYGSQSGTTLFADLVPGTLGVGLIEFAALHDDELYFGVGEPGDGGYQFVLWKTNGSPSATVRIRDICFDCQLFSSSYDFNGRLMFFLYENYGINILCATDGTGDGTEKLYSEFLDGSIPFSAALSDYLVFYTTSQGHSIEFLRTDGESTTSFWQFNSGARTDDISMAKVGNLVYFSDHAGPGGTGGNAVDPEDNMQVLVTDGRTVSALRDMFGVSFANADELVDYNGRLMFTTQDSIGQRMLWLYAPEEVAATFTIVNADTDEDIQLLHDGDVFDKAPDLNINIRYNPLVGEAPGSVLFKHQGKVVRRENEAPFALHGDHSGNYMIWPDATAGIHAIEAIPYSGAGGTGEAGQGLAVQFTIRVVEPCTAEGVITYAKWNSVPGAEVSLVPVNTEPSSVIALTSFEAHANQGPNYGSRISGYICPPQTGDYVFWITSNDQSELWLSSDGNPSNTQRIAWLSRATAPGAWNQYSTQQSGVIRLEKGKSYYVEALHKQGVGTDHLAVGWQLPDGMQEMPIPGSRLSPSSETYFAPVTSIDQREPQIYPNPARSETDVLTIASAESFAPGHMAAIEIYRLTGEIVYARDITCEGSCDEYSVPLGGGLGPGVYIVRIFFDGRETTKRLLVK